MRARNKVLLAALLGVGSLGMWHVLEEVPESGKLSQLSLSTETPNAEAIRLPESDVGVPLVSHEQDQDVKPSSALDLAPERGQVEEVVDGVEQEVQVNNDGTIVYYEDDVRVTMLPGGEKLYLVPSF